MQVAGEGHVAESGNPLRPHDRMLVETECLGEDQHTGTGA